MLGRHHLLPLFFFVLFTPLLTFGLFQTRFFRQLERTTLDMRFRLKTPEEKSAPIVHVDIDDESIQTIGRWPWPRNVHAQIVTLLDQLGARQIVFDVMFPDPQSKEITSDFQQTYPKYVNEYFSRLLDQQENLNNILQNWRTQNKITEEDLQVLERNLKKNKKLLSTQKQALKSVLDRYLTDPDQKFADTVKTAGNVYFPVHLKSGTPSSRSAFLASLSKNKTEREKMKSLLELYMNRFGAGIDTAVKNTRLPEQRIDQVEVTVKKWVAQQKARQFLATRDRPGPDGVQDLLDQLQISDDSAEARFVREAYSQARARTMIEQSFSLSLQNNPFPKAQTLIPPIPELTEVMSGTGHVDIEGSTLDGTVRRVPLIRSCNGKQYPMLGFSTALRAIDVSPSDLTVTTDGIRVPADPSFHIPIDEKGRVLLNWENSDWVSYQGPHLSVAGLYSMVQLQDQLSTHLNHLVREYGSQKLKKINEKRQNVRANGMDQNELRKHESQIRSLLQTKRDQLQKKFERARSTGSKRVARSLEGHVSTLEDKLQSLSDMIKKRDRQYRKLQETVRNKTCIIGSTHTGSVDLKPTPVSTRFPLVATHSTVFDMVYNQSFIETTPAWLDWLIVLIAAGIGALLSYPGAITRNLFLVLFIGFVYAAGNQILFQYGWLLPFASIQFSLLVSFGGMSIYYLFTVEQERKRTKQLFERYVDQSVVNEIMQNPEMVKMGGSRKRLTVVFMDLEGFTSLSEKSDPEEVVEIISTFLSEMTQVIFEYRGTIDKYEGDALLAYWGAPIELDRPEWNACQSVYRCLKMMPEMNKKIEKELPEVDFGREQLLNVRIGLNTGPVVMGNVGSKAHADFTVLGDTVNLASRLEEANKFFGTNIILTRSTYKEVEGEIRVRELGLVKVKGREEPVEVFELVGMPEDVTEETETFLALYERGRRAYYDRKWEVAQKRFQEALEIRDDLYCSFLINQIERFKGESPDEEDLKRVDLS